MSLLQSHLRPAELFQRVFRQRTPSNLMRAGAVGCCLLAPVSCSFDSTPRKVGRTSAATEPATRTDAAMASDASAEPARDAAAEQDAASGAMDAAMPRPSTNMVMTSPGAMTAPQRQRDAGAPPQRSMGGSSAPAPADAGAPRDAGVSVPNAGSVAPEPDPHCKEGLYAGTFSGSIQLIGLALSTVTGTVRTELMLNPAGTYLEIRNARVVGVDQDGNSLTVDLSGNINCASDQLEDGVLANGVFHNVASNTDTVFTGTAQAMYSEDPHSVVGTWTVQAEGLVPLLTGRGTWSLILND